MGTRQARDAAGSCPLEIGGTLVNSMNSFSKLGVAIGFQDRHESVASIGKKRDLVFINKYSSMGIVGFYSGG